MRAENSGPLSTHPLRSQKSKEPNPKQTTIEELESIRGLAALLVVFHHIPKWNPWLDMSIINNAYLMVDLFFVLSGFVIFKAYAHNITTSKDLVRFQFLRIFRLYPVHLTFLVVFLVIEIAKYVSVTHYGVQNIRQTPFELNSIKALIEHIFLVQAIGPTGDVDTFNGPAWSISVEFYTYLVFAMIVLLQPKRANHIFGFLALCSLALLATGFYLGFEDLIRCWAGFFGGCLVAKLIGSNKVRLPDTLSLIFFVAIVLFLEFKVDKTFDMMVYFLTTLMIACLMLSRGGVLNRVLRIGIFTWLGRISYSVYMSHLAVLWIVSNFIRHILKRPERLGSDQKWVLSLSLPESVMAVLFAFVLLMLVSQLTYRFIEAPCRRKARFLASQKFS